MRWGAFFGVTSVIVQLAGSAGAQPARDSAAAEALFEAGRTDVSKGDFVAACPKFAESHRLDPAPGTLTNLADCEERLGHLALAWTHWREALDLLAADDPRRPTVQDRTSAVDKRLPRLTLRIKEGTLTAAEQDTVTLKKDGVALSAKSLGVPLPVDPGTHSIVLAVSGRAEASHTLMVGESSRETLILEPGAPVASEKPVPVPESAPAPMWPGYVGLGVGGVGLVLGGITGLVAISKKQEVEDNCFPVGVCSPTGADAASSGRTFATVSTIGFVAGATFLTAGVLYLIFRKGDAPKSALLTGRF